MGRERKKELTTSTTLVCYNSHNNNSDEDDDQVFSIEMSETSCWGQPVERLEAIMSF